jgi:type VI secretion system secreted protein VgrG
MNKKATTVSSFPNLAVIGGGAGTVPAWTKPDLLVAAPAGIASHTPAHAIYSAGNTTSLSAGQDIQYTAQGHHSLVAKDGLVIFTYGKAHAASKPNTETGMQLHAASGNVNTQSQSGATHLTADKAVDVSSTHGMVRITAPQHVLLTAAGAAIELKGGNITLKGPGKVEFKASMKELAGAGSASQGLELKKPGVLKLCDFRMQGGSAGGAGLIAVG